MWANKDLKLYDLFLNAKNLLIKKFRIITITVIIILLINLSMPIILNNKKNPIVSINIVKALPIINFINSAKFSLNPFAVLLNTIFRLVKYAKSTANIIAIILDKFSSKFNIDVNK